MGRTYAPAFSWLAAAGIAALMASCGSIQVVSDGGSGSGGSGAGGSLSGSGGAPGMGGHGGTIVVDAGSAGGHVGSTGGATGQGGAIAGTGGAIAGTGGAIAGTGGTNGGTGGATATGGSSGTVDAGVDRGPCICPDIVLPVCGADGRTYGNACLAGCAGVAVAHQGACVDAGPVCTAVMGCCSMDSDCNPNQECAGVTCNANGRASGVCKATPPRAGNRCWTDADCPGQVNNTCNGAVVCPCGAACLRPDTLGTCG